MIRNSSISCFCCSGVACRHQRPAASEVIRWKFTCGITSSSTSADSFSKSPPWIALSALIRSINSVPTFSISASGVPEAAAGEAPSPKAAAARIARSERNFLSIFVLLFCAGASVFFAVIRGRIAVVDLVAPALQPGVAGEAVLVERGALQHALGREQPGPAVDQAGQPEVVGLAARADLVERIGDDVERPRGRVAKARRPEQGQHQVRARRHAPDAERLAEVLVVLLEPHLAGHVGDAAETEGGVDHETRQIREGLRRLALEHLV